MWQVIPIYDGRYIINEDGLIYNMYKKQYIAPHLDIKGYVVVTLLTEVGKPKIFSVSRLVAEAFLPNPYNLPVVLHLDGNLQNNNVDNLKWATQYERMQTTDSNRKPANYKLIYILNRDDCPVYIAIPGIQNVENKLQVDIARETLLKYAKKHETIPYGPFTGWQLMTSQPIVTKYLLYNNTEYIIFNTLDELIEKADLGYLKKTTISDKIYRNIPLSKGPYTGWRIKSIKDVGSEIST